MRYSSIFTTPSSSLEAKKFAHARDDAKQTRTESEVAYGGAAQHKRLTNYLVRLRGNKTVHAAVSSNQRDANVSARDEGEALGDVPIPKRKGCFTLANIHAQLTARCGIERTQRAC
ncbi:hypothetical protein PENSPDRAFT_460418 [Peniophora sp. CONT]|nr:hypothetical protein PENSPDRAFT_460418 [Peniophora sp. CONT]